MKSKMTFATLLASACLLTSAMPTAAFADHHKDPAAKKAKWDDVMKRLAELEEKAKKAESAPATKRVTSSSNDDVKLTIYGHVNRAMVYLDNGYNSQVRHVDNNVSSTRTRFTADAKLNECLKAGALMELEYISENSASVDIKNPHNKPAFAVRERLLDAFLDSSFGKLSLGQGEMASQRVMDLDYTGTNVIQEGFETQLMAGGTKFAVGKGDYFSANRITTVSSVISDVLGSKRLDRVRIDTPNFWGLVLSAAHATNERFDFGARYAAEICKIKMGGAFGVFVDKRPRRGQNAFNNISPSVITNNGTNASLQGSGTGFLTNNLSSAGTNNMSGFYTADSEYEPRNRVNYSQMTQLGGSVAVLFPFGLSMNAGYSRQNYDQEKLRATLNSTVAAGTNPFTPATAAVANVRINDRKNGYTWGIKLGYQAKFFEIGKTCIAGTYHQANRLRITDPNNLYTNGAAAAGNFPAQAASQSLFSADNKNKARVWGAYFVQNIDKLGTELYIGWQNHELKSTKVIRNRYVSTGTTSPADWGTPTVTTTYATNNVGGSYDISGTPVAANVQVDTYEVKNHKFKAINSVMAGMRIKF